MSRMRCGAHVSQAASHIGRVDRRTDEQQAIENLPRFGESNQRLLDSICRLFEIDRQKYFTARFFFHQRDDFADPRNSLTPERRIKSTAGVELLYFLNRQIGE